MGEPLKLEEVNRMMGASLKKALSMDIRPVAIAILDARGDLLAFNRMDGAMWRTVSVAQGKAAASAAFGQPSVELQDRYNTPVMNALTLSENGRLVPWQGALPIKRADGSLVGAIGVSGAKSDEDEAVGQAGIDVL
jgi:uncharacterized protein GlcG (DUF336 family)